MITAENIFDNFKYTMSGLERGLQVMHITTPAAQLLSCQHDEDIAAVLTRSELKPFDQIPVKKQKTIIGLLKKRECPEEAKGVVRDHMQPLGEKILVSADTPLLKFIQDQDDSFDRIVIKDTKIYGLVTKSDLLKLPVSLLGFALITHAETLMLNIIRRTRISDEIWLMWVPRHKGDIQRQYERLKSNRSELDKLELTYISDKSEILRRLAASEEFASLLPDKSFIDKLKDITALRNSIAHTGSISDNDDILQEFIERLRSTHQWIEGIEQWQTPNADTTR